MKPLVTVIIPYASYHERIVQRAIESAKAQLIPCVIEAGYSERTPAVFRNKAGFAARTPFLTFLDADDILHHEFTTRMLAAYQTDKYVYSSWLEDRNIKKPRPCPWSANSHHIVTTLYPTATFKMLGGFDEQLAGHEDADFYMRSYSRGICGVYVDMPLVNRPDDTGLRSVKFHQRTDYNEIIELAVKRNGGLQKIMACCGADGVISNVPSGTQNPGDILAIANWEGMRSEYSNLTGRMYIGGNKSQIWIDPKDLDLRGMNGLPLFAQVQESLAPTRESVLKEIGLL